jgi:hypothetical protein
MLLDATINENQLLTESLLINTMTAFGYRASFIETLGFSAQNSQKRPLNTGVGGKLSNASNTEIASG